MPRKEFDAFTRLDASDINTYLMDQSVMVFGGTAARGSAIATPTDGMAAYLQDSDSLTIYNGSAWTSVSTPPTLQFIESISFSAVASQSSTSVFSATYTNYKILINVSSASVNGAGINLRLRASGTDTSGSVYEVGEYKVGAHNSIAAASTNSSLLTNGTLGILNNTSGFSAEINMYDPFLASNTKYHSLGAGGNLQLSGVVMTDGLSYNQFTILCSSGNMTGTMTVYGIKES